MEGAMDEDLLNMEIRKFLKIVGISSQREIEKAVRQAVAARTLTGSETLSANMVLTIPAIGLTHRIDGTLELA
jgi:hypothetical protein